MQLMQTTQKPRSIYGKCFNHLASKAKILPKGSAQMPCLKTNQQRQSIERKSS